jgi:ubiquinone/menaquinone biosynthesis C-methylase UbiE
VTIHRWHFVDEAERRKWQDPEAILTDIGLKAGMTFVDIGCGEGFFTIPAAGIVGAGGKVFGVDADKVALQELQKKASAGGLDNLDLTLGMAEDTQPCQGCADIAFLGIVLHDFQDPVRVLGNARKMLKADGKLVNLDWKKQAMGFGPPFEKRFDEAAASRLIRSAGFQIENIKDSGAYHYLITARLTAI